MKPLFETITFHNSRTPADNLKALSFDTVPSKLSSFSVCRYHEHKHFAGEISETDGTFRIYPIVSYRSSFLPSIHGSITEENDGSKIEITISPPATLRIFFIFLLSFACLIFLFAILMVLCFHAAFPVLNFSCFFPLGLWHDALLLSERGGKMQRKTDLSILTSKNHPLSTKGWFLTAHGRFPSIKIFSYLRAERGSLPPHRRAGRTDRFRHRRRRCRDCLPAPRSRRQAQDIVQS